MSQKKMKLMRREARMAEMMALKKLEAEKERNRMFARMRGQQTVAAITLSGVILVSSASLVATGCDILGGKEDPKIPTTPTVPNASFKVAIKGNVMTGGTVVNGTQVGGKINIGGKLSVAITDNKNPGEPVTIRWDRDGVPTDVTKEEITILKTDAGKTIGCTVTIKGESVTATVAIPARAITITMGGSAINDKGEVGTTGKLYAAAELNWNATDANGKELPITYVWKRGTTIIQGAVTDTYELKVDDLGMPITVSATCDGITQTTQIKVPAAPTQGQTISAEILGTPGVGQRLTADARKNFSGELTYQWYANGQEIRGEDNYICYPRPSHSGQEITVKITCGGKSATSLAVTIPVPQWTPVLEQYETRLYASAKIGEFQFDANREGFSAKWYRDNVEFSNPIGYMYEIDPVTDAGKKIKVAITGYGATKTTPETLIPNVVVPVIPNPTIDWYNHTGLLEEAAKEIVWNIERAYRENLKDCATIINSEYRASSWRIDLVREDRKAIIENGKLYILFSTDWYETLGSNDAERQNSIATELKGLTLDAGFISEYTGNYEDIRMAKLPKPQPKKTLADLAGSFDAKASDLWAENKKQVLQRNNLAAKQLVGSARTA